MIHSPQRPSAPWDGRWPRSAVPPGPRRRLACLLLLLVAPPLLGCSPVPRALRPQDWFKKESAPAAPAKKAVSRSPAAKRVDSQPAADSKSAAAGEARTAKPSGIPMARDVGL